MANVLTLDLIGFFPSIKAGDNGQKVAKLVQVRELTEIAFENWNS